MHTIEPTILKLMEELAVLARTRDDAFQIPWEEGEALYNIALEIRARRVVEVGASYGFSGLFWGAALRQTGGRLDTIEIKPAKAEAARQVFARAGLSDIITVHQGDARDLLPKLDGEVDIAFLDADKPHTRGYFDAIWPRIRSYVLTDNTMTHRPELSPFVTYVRALPDALSAELAIGNGLEWTVKVPQRDGQAHPMSNLPKKTIRVPRS